MNAPAKIGHNQGPELDPIEAVIAEHDDILTEAQNWTDGEPVTDEASMNAVDQILKDFKAYKSALAKAGKERTDPLHKAWKAEVASVKVYTDDADRIQAALVAVVAPFKEKLAAEKRAAEQAAWEAAQKAKREADEKAAAANKADLDAQRELAEARQAAIDAEKAAQRSSKDGVKGMRKVTHWEITDMRDVVNWIARNDKEAMADFATEYARRNHKVKTITGVRVWETKEAF